MNRGGVTLALLAVGAGVAYVASRPRAESSAPPLPETMPSSDSAPAAAPVIRPPPTVLELDYCAIAADYGNQIARLSPRNPSIMSAEELRTYDTLVKAWDEAKKVCAWQKSGATTGRPRGRFRRFYRGARVGACCAACAKHAPCESACVGRSALAALTILPIIPP